MSRSRSAFDWGSARYARQSVWVSSACATVYKDTASLGLSERAGRECAEPEGEHRGRRRDDYAPCRAAAAGRSGKRNAGEAEREEREERAERRALSIRLRVPDPARPRPRRSPFPPARRERPDRGLALA